jgi:catechol 2,3-dioxygenase-like lactoylglutathione lyase family enzyme
MEAQMLDGACLGTNDIARAGRFYDAVLAQAGLTRLVDGDQEIGYGPEGGPCCLYIVTPFDGRPATWGNGTQMMFRADNPAAVDAFHRTAMELGGLDEGAPGPRSYSAGYYGAYCRDPDGNKLHVRHLGK